MDLPSSGDAGHRKQFVVTTDKIKVMLCRNHFERLVSGDVCDKCPSRLENKEAIMAFAKQYQNAPELDAAIMIDMRSIRSEQHELATNVESISHAINGNSGKGIKERLVVLETRFGVSSSSLATGLIVVGLIFSILLGAAGLVIEMTK